MCAPTDFQYLFIEDGIRYPGNKSTRTFNCTAYSLLPDDLEATYREKRGEGYQGYVANLTETCDLENKLQLITKVQVAPNNSDDDQFLAEALPNLKVRSELDEMYTDGGYGGKQTDPVLAEQLVTLIQSAIRGRNPDPDKPHLANFDIQFGEGGKPSQVTCPEGQKVSVHTTHQQKSYVACFELAVCQACPFYQKGCPAQPGKRDPGLHLNFSEPQANVSQRRRRSLACLKEGRNLRAAIEATVREVKHPFPASKLPVRGQFRVTCMVIGSALATNAHRIQRYLVAKIKMENEQKKTPKGKERS